MSNQTDPGLSVTEDTRLKMPVKTFIAIIVAVGVAAASWISVKADTAGNTRDVMEVKQEVQAIRQEQNAQRELLIRIDAKVSR